MYTTHASTTLPLRIAFTAATAGRGVLRAVATAFRNRQNRIALRELMHWDDHMLADIGLMRDDIRCALFTGRCFEPTRRLQILAVERRATARADAKRSLVLATVDGETLSEERNTWRDVDNEAA